MTYPWSNPDHDVMADIIAFKKYYQEQAWRPVEVMTPIRCFRVDEGALQLFTEDYVGKRNLVATCPDKDRLEWLVNCMVAYHKVNVIKET